MSIQHFHELSGPESARRLTAESIVVLPIGAIEHHGAHLPLSTDHTIVDAFAAAIVGKAGGAVDAWLLPSLAISKSDEHAWASGTVWLSWNTFMNVMIDIGRSLATSPVRRILLVNGHGGNSALLQVATRELRRQFGHRTFLMHPSTPVDQKATSIVDLEQGMGVHAGFEETAVMLHLRPDLVRMDLAERAVPETLAGFEHVGFGKSVSFGWLSDDFGTSGVIGDPRGATPDLGRSIFEDAVTLGAEALIEVGRFGL